LGGKPVGGQLAARFPINRDAPELLGFPLRPLFALPACLNLARNSDRSDSKQDYTNHPHANCLSGGLAWTEKIVGWRPSHF
jgi:hypothetical protein